MEKVALFTKMVEAMDGLDVSFKVGKESELIIRGDFMKMMNAFITLMGKQQASDDARYEIEKLKKDILD